MTVDNKKNNSKEEDRDTSEEKPKFVPKKYPRAWEIELTDNQRENLKQRIEEDTKKYREIGRELAENKKDLKLFSKIKDD
jgi:hypothetical protein